MELKRILARDTRSATEKAMALYGPDVLIISNNRVEGQTELIVALDVSEVTAEELTEETPTINKASETAEAMTTLQALLKRKADKSSTANNPFSEHLQQALKPESNAVAKEKAETASKTEQILTQGRDQARSQELVSLVQIVKCTHCLWYTAVCMAYQIYFLRYIRAGYMYATQQRWGSLDLFRLLKKT